MNIGNLKLKGRLILAPMAQINDLGFRLLCKDYGANLLFTEMINANGVVRNNKHTLKLAKTIPIEKPIALQLFGSRTDIIKKATKQLHKNFDMIDFNFGCPKNKIIRQGAGSALLKRPKKVKEIIEGIKSVTGLPVTGKIRLGFNDNHQNYLKIAQAIEDGGADAITLHARTVAQGYSGKANLNAIKLLKENINIPVIANGDINDENSYDEIKKTKADFFMIGRSAMMDPFIFKRLNYYEKTNKILKPLNKSEKIKDIIKYYNYSKKYDTLNYLHLKRNLLNLISGFENCKYDRIKLVAAKNCDDLIEIIRKL